MPNRVTERKPLPLRQYLDANVVVGGAIQMLIAFLVASLALSRSTGGALTAAALALIVAGAAFSSAAAGWPLALYGGAHDALEDRVAGDDAGDAPDAPLTDPFEPRPLWRRSSLWAIGASLWAGSGAVLVAAVLDGQRAALLVVAAAMAALAGLAGIVVDTVARAEGVAAARRLRTHEPPVTTLRRRAWRDIALPLAAVQVAVNAGFAWMLFRDYAVGEEVGDRALTRGAALADVVVVVALLTGIFGWAANRWGRVDASTGRVAIGERDLQGVTARAPLGRQGLVYVAVAAVILGRLAGIVLSPTPSLLGVVVVRGLFAGLLVFAAVGIAYVRGALNTAAGASPLPVLRTPDPADAEGLRPARPPGLVGASAAVLVLVVGLSAIGPAATDGARAAGLGALLNGEAEAFALRVEYDAPLPFGPGTIPYVGGEVRRAQAGENSKGLSAAPTRFDAVVAGTYYDPDKNRKGDENWLPQAECFYPGHLVDTSFRFPTGTRKETEPAPPVSHATARCDAGPLTELHARVGEAGEGSPVTWGQAVGDLLIAPAKGELGSAASAAASDISVLNGAIKVGAITVEGASSVTGNPGEQATEARVDLHDIEIGGTKFSIADDRILAGEQKIPLASTQADAFFDQLNAGLAPTQCEVNVAAAPDRYPQGFLFRRPEPKLGVADDGSFAASMRTGLMVVCDPPEQITEHAGGFNPHRMQILFGFVYTSTRTGADPGGFSLGDLGGALDGSGSFTAPTPSPAPVPVVAPPAPPVAGQGQASSAVTAPPPATTTTRPPPPRQAADGGGQETAAGPVKSVAIGRDQSVVDHWPVWALSLAIWLVLTHIGATRLTRVREAAR